MRETGYTKSSLDASPSSRLALIGLGVTVMGTGAVGQTIQFGEPTIYSDIARAQDIVTADLNGDGAVDIAIALDGDLQIYFNDQSGSFAHATTIPTGNVTSLTATDLESDRDIDLVWVFLDDQYDAYISAWYNDSSGLEGDIVTTSTSARTIPDHITVDITNDGLVDVVLPSLHGVIAMIAGADRQFTEQIVFDYPDSAYRPRGLSSGDIDADGDTDLFVVFQYVYDYRGIGPYTKGTQLVLLSNQSNGSIFELQTDYPVDFQTDNLEVSDLVIGDLDNDGDLDAAISGSPMNRPQYFNAVHFLRGDTMGGFTEASIVHGSEGDRMWMQLDDLNTDGRLDLAFTTDDIEGISVLTNEGDFSFSSQSPFRTGVWQSYFSLSDLTGDGQIDAATAGHNGLAVIKNLTQLQGPILSISPLVRGEDAVLRVRRVNPEEVVHFLYSMTGTGRTTGQRLLGGMTLDLAEPVLIAGSVRADELGVAVLRTKIPDSAPTGPVAVQAVVRRGPHGLDSIKTPFQVKVVQ